MMRFILPVLTVIGLIIVMWYAGAVALNAKWTLDQAGRAGVEVSFTELVADTMQQGRPRLPAPHQVAEELWNTTLGPCIEGRRAGTIECVTHRRSLFHHAWITLSVTLAGFGIGTVLGTLLAVGIVYNRAMDASVMPWVIASQTIPILAIAPMIIVVMNAVGLQGFIPKAIIATYLSFFPVVVGMVKGLRSPEIMQLDQMRTWNASASQSFWRLRLPASVPYLFTSLKVAVAAALVGTIVGEMPTGAVAGLGARLLAGSYYGQMTQIWSALLMAAGLAGLLIFVVGAVDKAVSKRMGYRA